MEKNWYSDMILVVMKNINLLVIFYISLLISRCLSGYIQENSALDFLTGISRMPMTAWKVPVLSVGLFVCCLLLLHIRSESNAGLLLKVCLELLVSFCISYVIGFSYTGMVLLIFADTMQYFPKSKWKFPFTVVICMFYLLMDFNLLSAYCRVVPFEAYLDYFQYDARSVLLGAKNILTSLNMLVFLIYIIVLVRAQQSEKERILNLNVRLNDTNEELRQAYLQLEEYANESERAAQTRERNRLAREIHDTLGHALTGIITGIEACTALMEIAPEEAKKQLTVIADVARQGMTDVRRSVKALRPDALEKLNLEKALGQMIDEMRCTTNIKILYWCTTRLNCFSEDEEDVIYRIVQECMTNSIRHGKAEEIQIRIDREYNMLKICIEDNGIGCADIKKGFGLHHMEERLFMLQGTLTYSGTNGFMVEAKIPIRWGTEEKQDD